MLEVQKAIFLNQYVTFLFLSGSCSQPFWDGTNLAKNDVIVISFNYRLGALGWMSMDHLSSELKGSANLGLLDQISKFLLCTKEKEFFFKKNSCIEMGTKEHFVLWRRS